MSVYLKDDGASMTFDTFHALVHVCRCTLKHKQRALLGRI